MQIGSYQNKLSEYRRNSTRLDCAEQKRRKKGKRVGFVPIRCYVRRDASKRIQRKWKRGFCLLSSFIHHMHILICLKHFLQTSQAARGKSPMHHTDQNEVNMLVLDARSPLINYLALDWCSNLSVTTQAALSDISRGTSQKSSGHR